MITTTPPAPPAAPAAPAVPAAPPAAPAAPPAAPAAPAAAPAAPAAPAAAPAAAVPAPPGDPGTWTPPATQAELDALLAQAIPGDYAQVKAQLKQIEDAGKSELQLANERVAELTAQAEALQRDAERAAVAADPRFAGVPAELLVGKTKAELEASAQQLVAWRAAAPPTLPGAWRAFSDPAQNGEPATPENEAKEAFVRSAFAAFL